MASLCQVCLVQKGAGRAPSTGQPELCNQPPRLSALSPSRHEPHGTPQWQPRSTASALPLQHHRPGPAVVPTWSAGPRSRPWTGSALRRLLWWCPAVRGAATTVGRPLPPQTLVCVMVTTIQCAGARLTVQLPVRTTRMCCRAPCGAGLCRGRQVRGPEAGGDSGLTRPPRVCRGWPDRQACGCAPAPHKLHPASSLRACCLAVALA